MKSVATYNQIPYSGEIEGFPLLPQAPEAVTALFERTTRVNFDDLHSVAGAALRMPAITAQDLRDGMTQVGEGLRELRNVEVPLDRVVGIYSMPGWHGRGLDKDGTASRNGEYSSLSGIAYYGKQGQGPDYQNGSSPHLMAFTDSEGEVWFMGRNDGSHRIAAAKLSGDATLIHADVAWADSLPSVKFSVAEVLKARDKRLKTVIGNFVLRGAVKRLVTASIKLDDKLAAYRRMSESLGGEFWV